MQHTVVLTLKTGPAQPSHRIAVTTVKTVRLAFEMPDGIPTKAVVRALKQSCDHDSYQFHFEHGGRDIHGQHDHGLAYVGDSSIPHDDVIRNAVDLVDGALLRLAKSETVNV